MRWSCKICSFRSSKLLDLLKHYRLKHLHTGQGRSLPCLYSDCPCSFKGWGALRTHLSRDHTQSEQSGQIASFSCLVCNSCSYHTERQYFEHLGVHLKKHETVHCVFKDCDYNTNIYSTFASHKSRKHNPHCLEDFKHTVFQTHSSQETADNSCLLDESEVSSDETLVKEGEDLGKAIFDELFSLLLKLHCIFNVPSRCINEIVEEFQFITSSASAPIIKCIVHDTFENHNCAVEEFVITDLVKRICQLNPISAAFSEEGPLGTAYKINQYLKEHFSIVEPLEYILDAKEGRTFQYVPILQSLSQILKNSDIQEKVLKSSRHCVSSGQYSSFHDGSHFKENTFLSGEELRLSLLLYCDDFEICNPLGTSRKKHKVTGIYWVLADIPTVLRSTLSSIYLAVLCKADDIKTFGYPRVLEPLLSDLKSFEEDGVFVPCLGKIIKGTVFSVIADNLGAHSVGGFVESFSGTYVCRFCIGERSQFQELEVRTGAFPGRTKPQHKLDVEVALDSNTPSHGVKRHCAITQRLNHFHVTTGYPPDILHYLLEGIVPVELALCLDVLIKKKYFSHQKKVIKQFPYKWKDETNCPQGIPATFASRKTIGGNAHENWCLLRLLPLMVGWKVQEEEQEWQLLMTLKDIVELVMSPTHMDESIGHLDSLIAEHRLRFFSVFPQGKLIPKHHFLEHYPQLIKEFGPLVSLWTMRFEAKHRFFKRIVRHASCFRNILMSMAKKHHSMIAYHLHGSNVKKPDISVSKMSTVPLEVVNENIQDFVSQKFPGETVVHLTKRVDFQGTSYGIGMMLVYGSTGGLPEFAEILQIIIVRGSLVFVVKLQSAWYCEHLRCFKLESTSLVKVLEQPQLTDTYPLATYSVEGNRMVSLKHHICLSN